MTKKLTKTAEMLLKTAQTKGFVIVSRGSGRGPQGGRIYFGSREADACINLAELGLLKRVKTTKECTAMGNGNNVWVTDTRYEPTQA